jgi:hypothetical protein
MTMSDFSESDKEKLEQIRKQASLNKAMEQKRNKRNEVRKKENMGPPKSPGVAAVLSFFLPGLGQIYNG